MNHRVVSCGLKTRYVGTVYPIFVPLDEKGCPKAVPTCCPKATTTAAVKNRRKPSR